MIYCIMIAMNNSQLSSDATRDTSRQSLINNIKTIFSIEQFETNKEARGCYIDLYMPKYRLAIVYNSEQHAIDKQAIELLLGCTIVEIEANMNVFVTAGVIYSAIRAADTRILAMIRDRALTDLPHEILLMIVCAARKCNMIDRRTLKSLTLVSKTFNAIMWRYRKEIIDHYTVEEYANSYTFCGQFHRGKDLPAKIYNNGTQEWYQHGVLHRGHDRPAVMRNDGSEMWYWRGKLHRDNDRPAIIYKYGHHEWYKHGKLHRGDDEPAVIYSDGTMEWWKNGKLHRNAHRPAIVRSNGICEWYIHGVKQ